MEQKKLTNQFQHNRNLIREAVQITKNEDMKFREFRIAGRQAAVVFIDGMVDLTRLQHFILSPCMQLQKIPAFPKKIPKKHWRLPSLQLPTR